MGKQTSSMTRASAPQPEQGLLLPPLPSQAPSHSLQNKTMRGPLGAIMPDLYLVGSTCVRSSTGSSNIGSIMGNVIDERTSDDISAIINENLHQLHIRTMYDDHRNDLIVNIIEGQH